MILLVVIGVLCGAPSSGQADEGPRHDLNIVSPKLAKFEFVEEGDLEDAKVYIFKQSDEYLKIKKMPGLDERSSNILVEEDIVNIKAVYSNAFSAYPGEVSNEIVCNEAYKPVFLKKTIDERRYRYVLLYSTKRFSLGACDADNIGYRYLIGWLYCPRSEELYTFKYFASVQKPSEDMTEMFFSFNCDVPLSQ